MINKDWCYVNGNDLWFKCFILPSSFLSQLYLPGGGGRGKLCYNIKGNSKQATHILMKAASKKERAASWGADGNDRERAVKEGRTGKPGLSNHSCGHLLMTPWWRRLPALGSNKMGSGFPFLEAQPPPCLEKPDPNHCVSDLTSFHKQILFLLKPARVGSDVWYWPWPRYLILGLYRAWYSTLIKKEWNLGRKLWSHMI